VPGWLAKSRPGSAFDRSRPASASGGACRLRVVASTVSAARMSARRGSLDSAASRHGSERDSLLETEGAVVDHPCHRLGRAFAAASRMRPARAAHSRTATPPGHGPSPSVSAGHRPQADLDGWGGWGSTPRPADYEFEYLFSGFASCANVPGIASALPRSARFARLPLARSLAGCGEAPSECSTGPTSAAPRT
jgi:hypothetical protein